LTRRSSSFIRRKRSFPLSRIRSAASVCRRSRKPIFVELASFPYQRVKITSADLLFEPLDLGDQRLVMDVEGERLFDIPSTRALRMKIRAASPGIDAAERHGPAGTMTRPKSVICSELRPRLGLFPSGVRNRCAGRDDRDFLEPIALRYSQRSGAKSREVSTISARRSSFLHRLKRPETENHRPAVP